MKIVNLWTTKSKCIRVNLTVKAINQLKSAMRKAFYDPITGRLRPTPEGRIQIYAESGVCLVDEPACNLRPFFSVTLKG